MKIYKLPQLADANNNNEYCLGPGVDTNSVYLLYGRLRPGETARMVTTPEGAEEIICVVKGTVKVKSGNSVFTVTAGEAFISGKPQTFILDNAGSEEAIYISAGARAGSLEKNEKPPGKPAEPAAGKIQAAHAAGLAEEASMSKAEDEAGYIITEDETLEEEA